MSNAMNRVPIAVQAATLRAVFALPTAAKRLIAGKPVRIDGQELALDAQLLLKLQQLSGNTSLAAGTPQTARAQLAATRSLLKATPIGPMHVREHQVPVGGDATIVARLYTPEGLEPGSPLLVFYHGGGWVIGDLETHDPPCRFLAKHANIRVLSVDYRLAPEHTFPTAVEDAVAAYEWAHANADELGADPTRLAVGGDSAGGNLAAVTAHHVATSGGQRPVFQLLFYPGVDGTMRRRSRDLFADGFFLTSEDMAWFCDHYVPDVSQRADPRFSILLAADLTGLPPAYIATAGFDPLRDEGEEFGARLAADGVPVVVSRQDDLIHGYANMLTIGGRFKEAMFEAVGALRTGLSLATPQKKATRKTARKTTKTAS